MDDVAKIMVVSDGEAELCDFVICVPKGFPSPFTDNLDGECAHCGKPIIFRPHVPKKPPKICFDCVVIMTSGTRQ